MDKKEDALLWRNRYETFVNLYKGRDDIIARQKKDGRYVPIEGEGLTFERFLNHVQLRETYAIYNLDNLKRVRFGLFDVDVLPRNQEWSRLLSGIEEKKKETIRIMKTLMDMGLKRQNILMEFPTVGFHVLIFFKNPVDAKNVKVLMKKVLASFDLLHIPFYPQKIEESPYGDRIQLPLRMNLNTSRRSNFIRDLESFNPEYYNSNPDFSILEEVEPIESEWVIQWVHK